MASHPLAGKCALVAGTSGALPSAVARALASSGASVFLAGAEGEGLAGDTIAEIRADGGDADFHPVDLAAEPALFDLIDIVLARFRRLDILINVSSPSADAPLLASDRAAIDAALNSAVRGPIFLTQAALPALLKSAPSEIVNISSTAGLHASAESTIACASQSGLVGFSRALSLELRAAGIRVTTLCPGPLPAAEVAAALIHALLAPSGLLHEPISFFRE